MPTVEEVLGLHTYMIKYGISPEEELYRAAEKLEGQAPHLAKLLKELGAVFYTAGGV